MRYQVFLHPLRKTSIWSGPKNGEQPNEVIDLVIERLAEAGDAELGHAGEVALSEPPRLVDLGEEDLLGWTFEGPPLFDPTLQGAELDVGETTGESTLDVEEEGLGLKPRVAPEQVDEFGPEVLERFFRIRQV